MKYVIADIHGCWQAYQNLLQQIGLREEDELFVLGDAMDRGPEPIRVIRDLMARPNVTYILGNHDAMMLLALEHLAADISPESIAALSPRDFLAYSHWLQEGGEPTAAQFTALSPAERRDILDYLSCAPLYETVEQDGCLYILLHAGLDNFDPSKDLEEYTSEELLWARMDYSRQYYPGDRIFLVSGHTPTPLIGEDNLPLVYQDKGHIALDCGCVFGGNLAAYCIDDGSITYAAQNENEV